MNLLSAILCLLVSANTFFDINKLKDEAVSVGDKIAGRFIDTPHRWFREGEELKRITYAEAVTWAGAIRYAVARGDTEKVEELKMRYIKLLKDRPELVPKPVHVDHSVFGIIPLELYLATGEERFLSQGLHFADAQWGEEGYCQFGKKKRMALYDSLTVNGLSWQSRFWVDDMYMITILQTSAYRATGERKYIDRAAEELVRYINRLERENGLYHHGEEAPFFWGRGNGWVASGLVEVLENLPLDSTSRETLLSAFRRMMSALKVSQDSQGYWHQLIDCPESFPESSCTGMFSFAILSGIRNGWIPADEYSECAGKAWNALEGFIEENGDVKAVCEGTSKRDYIEWYLNRKQQVGDFHGQAPVLWTARQALLLGKETLSVPAFPGAEGGGMFASGGRGGKVLKVTSLCDDGSEGTLRWAVEQPGPRIIVFEVGGLISLNSDLWIRNPDITIAGQTAPAPGICIRNYTTHVAADNVIIRYLRFRMGAEFKKGTEEGDVLTGKYYKKNIIIDHCSISWGTDENASFYTNSDFTMQWCIISESLRLAGHSKGQHGFGAIWGGRNASFHHNIIAHNDNRNPRFDPGRLTGRKHKEEMLSNVVDFRNNTVYNWGRNVSYGGEAMKINFIANYYKAGPASVADGKLFGMDCETKESNPIYGKWGKVYMDGNVYDSCDDKVSRTTGNNFEYGVIRPGNSRIKSLNKDEKESLMSDKAFETALVTTQKAGEAFISALTSSGCSKFRDSVDKRIVEEIKTRTATCKGSDKHNGIGRDENGFNWKSESYPKAGIIDSPWDTRPPMAESGWNPWSEYFHSKSKEKDSDGDGMPDKWEKAKGLDPFRYNPSGRDIDAYYDNIEVYINEII